MSLELQFKKSVWQTAVLHLLRNAKKAPSRTARNLCELCGERALFTYDEILDRLRTDTPQNCLRFLNSHMLWN